MNISSDTLCTNGIVFAAFSSERLTQKIGDHPVRREEFVLYKIAITADAPAP